MRTVWPMVAHLYPLPSWRLGQTLVIIITFTAMILKETM